MHDLPSLSFLAVCTVLCHAVWVDLQRHEIPDRCSVLVLAITGASIAAEPSWLALASGFAAMCIGALLSLALYRASIWGGGDVKLATALSAWVGLPALDLLWTGFAGLGIVVLLIARFSGRPEVAFAPVLAGGLMISHVFT